MQQIGSKNGHMVKRKEYFLNLIFLIVNMKSNQIKSYKIK